VQQLEVAWIITRSERVKSVACATSILQAFTRGRGPDTVAAVSGRQVPHQLLGHVGLMIKMLLMIRGFAEEPLGFRRHAHKSLPARGLRSQDE
jgi:hypothetical protein